MKFYQTKGQTKNYMIPKNLRRLVLMEDDEELLATITKAINAETKRHLEKLDTEMAASQHR